MDQSSPRRKIFGKDKSTNDVLEGLYQQMAEWRIDYRRKVDAKSEEIASLKSTLEAKDLQIKQLKGDTESASKVIETQKELFSDKSKSLEILMSHQKEQLSELIHTNESLNSKLSGLRHEYSSKLDTATSRILELESVLSLAKVEAEARLKEITRLSSNLVAEQSRFKDLLSDFCTKIAIDLPNEKYSSYEVNISLLTSSRNKLEANIYDLLRINGNSSLLTQETEDLFTTVNELNNMIKQLKSKNRGKIKKMMDQYNSNEEQYRSLKAELSETVHRLEVCKSELKASNKQLEGSERRCKDLAHDLSSSQSKLVEVESRQDNFATHIEELKREMWKYQQLHLQSTQEITSTEEAIRKVEGAWRQKESGWEVREKKYAEECKLHTQTIKELTEKLKGAHDSEDLKKMYEEKIAYQKMAFESISSKHDDVSSRLASGIQELKNMQTKLHSLQQLKEEADHRLHDAELRNSLLLSDFAELQKQKEESEATLQSRVKILTEEVEGLNDSMKSKALKMKTTSFKITELEKVISDIRAESEEQKKSLESEIGKQHLALIEMQQRLETCKADLDVSQNNLHSCQTQCNNLELELTECRKNVLDKDKKMDSMQALADDFKRQLEQIRAQHTNSLEDLQGVISNTESKLKMAQTQLNQEQNRWMEQEQFFRDQERKLKEGISLATIAKEEMEYKLQTLERSVARKQEAALLDLEESNLRNKGLEDRLKKSEAKVAELLTSLEVVNGKLEESSAHLVRSNQEVKNLQARTHSLSQEKEELDLHVKDVELRNSLLLSDFAELKKQKEESEETLQGRIQSLTEEVEGLNNTMKSKALKMKTTSFKIAELEKVISDLRTEAAETQTKCESDLAKARLELAENQQKLDSCQESLLIAQRNADGLERKCKSQEAELADIYNLISEKDSKITRLTQLLTVLHEEKDALQISHEREAREMSLYRADAESKLQDLQSLLDVEQLSSKEQAKSYQDLNSRYQLTLKDLAAAKDDLLRKMELEALNSEQIKLFEININDLKGSLASAKTKYDDVAQRLSNGIQELKSMQAKLHNALQAKEQCEHKLKDAELRNSLLQSDFAELQKQKDDNDAALQGRLNRFTEELNAANLTITGLNANINTLAIEKAEHSKTIVTLGSRLERKEADVHAMTERFVAEKEQLKQLLTRVCWKASMFCEQVGSRLTQLQTNHGEGGTLLVSSVAEKEPKTPEQSPHKGNRSKASPSSAKSPSVHNSSQFIVDVDGLESRIDHLVMKHEEVTAWCNSELQRLYAEQNVAKQELVHMKKQLSLGANDKKDLEELNIQLAEKVKLIDDLQKKLEQQKSMTDDSRHAFVKLQKEYEHAEAIVTKQKQALEGANEVMKKQRFDLDDLSHAMQVKKQDQEEMSKVLMSQQKSIAESQLIIDHLNMLVHTLRSDKKCLEMEVKEYHDALTTVIQRFQKEFGSLQSQLADLNVLSLM